MRTYAIELNAADNRGCFWADAMAHSVEGRVVSASENYGSDSKDFVVIEVADENLAYLEELLDQDDRVTAYREQ